MHMQEVRVPSPPILYDVAARLDHCPCPDCPVATAPAAPLSPRLGMGPHRFFQVCPVPPPPSPPRAAPRGDYRNDHTSSTAGATPNPPPHHPTRPWPLIRARHVARAGPHVVVRARTPPRPAGMTSSRPRGPPTDLRGAAPAAVPRECRKPGTPRQRCRDWALFLFFFLLFVRPPRSWCRSTGSSLLVTGGRWRGGRGGPRNGRAPPDRPLCAARREIPTARVSGIGPLYRAIKTWRGLAW